MKTQSLTASPTVRVDPPRATRIAGPGQVRLAAEDARAADPAPKRRLPYPVMKVSELIEEWLRHRIQNPARQSESRA